MEGKNTFKIWFFIILLLTTAIGGYFLMKKYTNFDKINNTSSNKTISNNTTKGIRIDNKKDYIYFTDDEMIDEDYDISFPKVVINFEDISNVEGKLNNKTEELKKETKYENDELVYAHYPSYFLYAYENYLSLVCEYYTYDSKEDMMTYKDNDVYVFDINTGELYTSGRLLSLFNLTVDKIKQKVKSYVNDADLVNGDEITLDVDATLANLSMDKLYVDKRGKLSIGVVVKSSEKDYNEVIVLS